MSKKKSPSPLEAHLGFWLRQVSNHVSFAFNRKLAAREIAVAEWVVLSELQEHGELLPSALAERLGITRGGVSKLVDRLETKQLVARQKGSAASGDGRQTALGLTAKGRALVPALAALADENDAEFFGHLDKREREQLMASMKSLVEKHGLRTAPTE